MLWLAIFFLIPMGFLAYQSLQSGLFPDFHFTWAFSNFSSALSGYHTQLVRSFVYAGIATLACLVLGYPLAQAFLRVTLPLSAPGIVAGTLLTFIPAAGDFINAYYLGTPNQQMIGNVIQAKFLESLDYPTAASLSFILMGTIMIMLLVYVRIVGTEKLTG